MGQTNVKTIWVTRLVSDSGSEVEVLEDRKGKKRRAKSLVPAKKKVSVKVEKVEKTKEKVQKMWEKGERPKVKVERTKAKVEQPKASRSKHMVR
jgi:hydrogenase maturation factor HypF (carbamoyltransferase family)